MFRLQKNAPKCPKRKIQKIPCSLRFCDLCSLHDDIDSGQVQCGELHRANPHLPKKEPGPALEGRGSEIGLGELSFCSLEKGNAESESQKHTGKKKGVTR